MSMKTALVEHAADFAGWRDQARELLRQEVQPAMVNWQVAADANDLFAESDAPLVTRNNDLQDACTRSSSLRVPASFMDLAQRVVCHSDPRRFALLYRVLWRLAKGEKDILTCCTDDDMHALNSLAKAVSRDRHKMTAFVRFRQTPGMSPEHYSAWFEPSHHILRLTSPFFCKRFSNMHWSIYTPEGSAHWNTKEIAFGPPGSRDDLPDAEVMEDIWRTYFANIFNPARLRISAMQSEMPVKYWKNLPEAPLIAELIHNSGKDTERMVEAAPTTAPRYTQAALKSLVTSCEAPANSRGTIAVHRRDSPYRTMAELKQAASACAMCAHACDATQTVFGSGSESASVMIVGEQPGDIEDVRGRPFVGPSGKLIRKLLAELSLDDNEVYFTNAVKHFKYTVKGKRRIHQTPSAGNIEHCRSWLSEELRLVKPAVVIALGASAAKALLGRSVSIEQERGKLRPLNAHSLLMITTHPAYALRAVSQKDQREREVRLKNDMAVALETTLFAEQVPLALGT